MEENEVQAQEEVVEQEETTEEEQKEETQDVLTLTGEEKAEYEKYKAKKEERRKFAEQAKSAPPKKTYDVTAETLERIELRQDGYSKEEVEAIMELGGSKALNNPLVKTAIEAMRTKQKSEDANVSPNSKSPVYKKFTQADLQGMSSKELEAILPRE